MPKRKNNSTEFNFWPSIADMLLAIFMVFLMLWLTEKLIFLQGLDKVEKGQKEIINELKQQHQTSLEVADAKIDEEISIKEQKIDELEQCLASQAAIVVSWQKCEGEKKECEDEKISLADNLANCEHQNAHIQSNLESCTQNGSIVQHKLEECKNAKYHHDKPPIILLKEAEKFSFPIGKAELSPDFEDKLRNDVIPKIVNIKKEYNINTVEVIGHTDGLATRNTKFSNLDTELENAVAKQDVSNLYYGSNADLGLIRALAVVFFLQKQPEVEDFKFRVYSAAQLILTNGELAQESTSSASNESRRRIELRFTHY